MKIEIDTDLLTVADSVSLLALVMTVYPGITGHLDSLAMDAGTHEVRVAPVTIHAAEDAKAPVPPVTSAPAAAPQPAASSGSAPPAPSATPVPPGLSTRSTSAPMSDGAPEPPVYDSKGVQWDENHHAGSKAITTDGTWRARRGGSVPGAPPPVTDPSKAAQAPAPVETPTPPAPPAPTPPAETPAPPTPAATPAPVETPTPPAPPAPPAETPAPPAPPADASVTPISLMTLINGAMTTGKLEQAQLDTVLSSHGLKTARDVFMPDNVVMLPSIKKNIDAYIAAAQ